jgi:hypothetical protein
MTEASGAALHAGELAERLARLRARLDEFRGRL